MQNFTFHNPTRILFGEGQIANLTAHVPPGARILVTYGGGSIKQNGVYDQVVKALEGCTWLEFGGIEVNPHFETLMQATELVKEKDINFLLAVGGGSVVDGTKLIAAAVYFDGDPWDILAKSAQFTKAMPLACVLTLPATGTESNGNSVITKAATQEKLAFGSPLVYPVFAVLDPATTFSLPTKQISNGVVDAFVHTIEQYLTYPVDAKVQDRAAEGLLMTLIEEGPKALSDPSNYAVRANVMWAATQALNGLIGVGVPQDWATHMIGHEITALHGLDHAQTLAIVLPSLMNVQRKQKSAKIQQFGRRVFGLDGNETQLIDQTIAATAGFFEKMGIPTRLSAYNIPETSITTLVENLVKHGGTSLGEHKDITPEVSRKILQGAY